MNDPSARGGLRSATGFFRGLRPFLAQMPPLVEARLQLDRQLAERERTFAAILERAIFQNPSSPYRHLLRWARIEQPDVLKMLAADGLSATLERLYQAGVYVTLEEFKGRRPIVRGNSEIQPKASDFDNPITTGQYEASTGGSSGPPRPVYISLDLLEYESTYHALFLTAAGIIDRPVAIWHLAPPGSAGIKIALIQARLNRPVERWFSQNRLDDLPFRHAAFARAASLAASLCGRRIPVPEYTPSGEAAVVARWLASKRAAGTPGVLATTASAAVRTCMAAFDAGLDIEGSFFVVVGEPFTTAKAAVIAKTGSDAACHYAMTEAGIIGLACRSSDSPDDVHLLDDKVATVERRREVLTSGRTVSALFHSTLLPASPKIMLNVESGDTGVRQTRRCSCRALPGFDDHLHTIRSYDKLTSEGMHFLGADLFELVEEMLPRRFGGHPTDYQLVEREQNGLPRVSVMIRPSVGAVDDRHVVEAVLNFLRDCGQSQQLMADVWSQSQTLSVVRGDPHFTPGGKILPLRTLTE